MARSRSSKPATLAEIRAAVPDAPEYFWQAAHELGLTVAQVVAIQQYDEAHRGADHIRRCLRFIDSPDIDPDVLAPVDDATPSRDVERRLSLLELRPRLVLMAHRVDPRRAAPSHDDSALVKLATAAATRLWDARTALKEGRPHAAVAHALAAGIYSERIRLRTTNVVGKRTTYVKSRPARLAGR